MMGTKLPKVDSSIIELAKIHSKKFKAVTYNNIIARSLIILKYQYHNREMEEALKGNYGVLTGKEGNYDLAKTLTDFQHKVNDITNRGAAHKSDECENDSYFYNEGIKAFQQGDYKVAISHKRLTLTSTILMHYITWDYRTKKMIN